MESCVFKVVREFGDAARNLASGRAQKGWPNPSLRGRRSMCLANKISAQIRTQPRTVMFPPVQIPAVWLAIFFKGDCEPLGVKPIFLARRFFRDPGPL